MDGRHGGIAKINASALEQPSLESGWNDVIEDCSHST